MRISMLRPLASFTAQEIGFYNLYKDLKSAVHVPWPQTDPHGSVQDLLAKFITNLNTNFPATASTILRTGEKLNDKPIDGFVLCTQCKVQECLEIKSSVCGGKNLKFLRNF